MAHQEFQQSDSLQKTIQAAVDAAISNFQPRLNESMNDFAEKAIDATQGAARQVVRTAQRNPWYFAAGAAAILMLAGYLVSSLSSQDKSAY